MSENFEIGARKYKRRLNINTCNETLKGCMQYSFHVSWLVLSIALSLQTINAYFAASFGKYIILLKF